MASGALVSAVAVGVTGTAVGVATTGVAVDVGIAAVGVGVAVGRASAGLGRGIEGVGEMSAGAEVAPATDSSLHCTVVGVWAGFARLQPLTATRRRATTGTKLRTAQMVLRTELTPPLGRLPNMVKHCHHSIKRAIRQAELKGNVEEQCETAKIHAVHRSFSDNRPCIPRTDRVRSSRVNPYATKTRSHGGPRGHRESNTCPYNP